MLLFGYDNNPNDPMLLLIDNSDSPSIVEQLSQGPGLVYDTFIDDGSQLLIYPMPYALFLASCSMGSPTFLIIPLTLCSPLSLCVSTCTAPGTL